MLSFMQKKTRPGGGGESRTSSTVGQSVTSTLASSPESSAVSSTSLQMISPPLESVIKSADWSLLPPMRQQRAGFAAAVTNDGRFVYVAGGYSAVGPSTRAQELSHAEVFDVAAGCWIDLPPLKAPRQGCAGVWLPSRGLFVVIGGYSEKQQYVDSVEAFDPARQKWMSLPHLQQKRRGHAATVVGGSCIYVFGGNCRGAELRSVERLEEHAPHWTPLSQRMSRFRNRCAAVTLYPQEFSDENNEAGGGTTVMVLGGENCTTRYTSAECLDTRRGEWVDGPWGEDASAKKGSLRFLSRSKNAMANMTYSRDGLAAVAVSHKAKHCPLTTMVVALGGSDGPSFRERIEFYHVQRNEWKTDKQLAKSWSLDDFPIRTNQHDDPNHLPSRPQSRHNGAAVYLPPIATLATTPSSEESTTEDRQEEKHEGKLDAATTASLSSSSNLASNEGNRKLSERTSDATESTTTMSTTVHANPVNHNVHRILMMGGLDCKSKVSKSVSMLTLTMRDGDDDYAAAIHSGDDESEDEESHKTGGDNVDDEDGEDDLADSGEFFRLLVQLDDTVFQPKLVELLSLISSVHHMKLYYTAVANLYRMGLLSLEERNYYIKQGLEQTVDSVTSCHEAGHFQRILDKALEDGILMDGGDVVELQTGAMVGCVRNSDFVKDMQRAIRNNSGRIIRVEGTLDSLASSIQLLEGNIEKVNDTVIRLKAGLRRQRKVEAGVAFLCAILNAVSFGVAGGAAAGLMQMTLGKIVDFGDVAHIRQVAETTNDVQVQHTIESALQLVELAGSRKLDQALLKSNDPMMIIVAAAAITGAGLSSEDDEVDEDDDGSGPGNILPPVPFVHTFPNEGGEGGESVSTQTGRTAKLENIGRWLLSALPKLDDNTLHEYVDQFDRAGFDCPTILDNDLGEDDIDFMKTGHRRALWRWLTQRRQETGRDEDNDEYIGNREKVVVKKEV